jgi:hypothetical protein
LLSYFESSGFDGATGFAPLIVNSGLEIIFNGLFEVHIFGGINIKSRIVRRIKIEDRGRLPSQH